MLRKHSLLYFLGRGVPGLISFFAITVYTHLITPDEYGKYALVITSVLLLNSVIFQWIRLSLLRFLPTADTDDDKRRLYGSVGIGYIGAIVFSGFALLIYILFVKLTRDLAIFLAIGFVLLAFEAFFEISLEYFRSNLNVNKYSMAFVLKSFLSVALGTLFAWLQFGAAGIVTGVIISDVIVFFIFFRPFFISLVTNLNRYDKGFFAELLRYGLPLTISYAMAFIVNSSDRYFIDYYLGKKSTGFYSVGYDISRQTLWIVMQSINLASYPLAVRALHNDGVEKAREQLESNVILLMLIATPTAFGMAALAARISEVFIGHQFAGQVGIIIPFISLGALVAGFKNFYVDQSFQLGKKTFLQIWAVVIAAIVNIVLNIILIPRIGIMGAIYSTIICFIIALIVSFFLSKKSFDLPFPWLKLFKIFACAVGMMFILNYLSGFIINGLAGLLILVIIGSFFYFLFTILLGILQISSILSLLKINKLKKQ